MLFRDRDEAVAAIHEYNLFQNRDIRVHRSFDGVWEVRCLHRQDGCKWRAVVRRRTIDQSWQLKKYEFPHTCLLREVSKDNHSMNSTFIAHAITHVIHKDPSIPVPQIQKQMLDRFKLEPSYRKAWYAKNMAIQSVYGQWEQSFQLLSRWLLAARERIPGTVVAWTTYNYFLRGRLVPGHAILDKVFWCFGPCVEAFRVVRPVIFVDGTHLYGKYKGVMLIATAVDGDNRLIPLAHAVVHRENDDTWPWFLNLLHRHVIADRKPVTIVSDRHASLVNAMVGDEHWRDHYWRYCFRHLKSNYRARVKRTDWADRFYSTSESFEFHYVTYYYYVCAYYYFCLKIVVKKWEVPLLEKGLVDLMAKDTDLPQFLEGLGPRSRWTIAEDNGARWGHDTTNVAESMNGVLKKARNLPILALAMTTMRKTIEWFEWRRAAYTKKLEEGTLFFERHVTHMTEQAELAREYIARSVHAPLGLYEIELAPYFRHGQALTLYKVDLRNKTCDCTMFQALRMPCSHAIAACQHRRIDPYSLIDEMYSVAGSLRAYDGIFYSVGDETTWPACDTVWVPDPERERSSKGRPVTTRIHNDMDVLYHRADRTTPTPKSCGFCHQPGHNRKTCPINPASRAPRE